MEEEWGSKKEAALQRQGTDACEAEGGERVGGLVG